MKSVYAVHKLARIIEETIAAMPDATSLEMANHVMVHHSAEIAAWLVSRFEVKRRGPAKKSPLIGKRPRLGHPKQIRLPLPGFEDIPMFLVLAPGGKRGKRVRLLSATLQDQIVSLELAVHETAEELAQRRRLIALTRRYDKKQPGITVREVFKLQTIRNAEAARKRAARTRTKKATER